MTSFDPACEISYKKVGDGHPLRLWRCKTEVEAPRKLRISLSKSSQITDDCIFFLKSTRSTTSHLERTPSLGLTDAAMACDKEFGREK
jgi:hypothetical protein